VHAGQVLGALIRRVVVDRADDLDDAEDERRDRRHGDDRDEPPAHAPVSDGERRALARRGLATAGEGSHATTWLPGRNGQARLGRGAVHADGARATGSLANGSLANGSLANGQRSAL